MTDVARLHRETEAAKDLLSNIAELIGDDADAKFDAIEGQTSLFEAIEKVVAYLDECDILLTGIKSQRLRLSTREKDTKARSERIRAHIEQTLMVLNICEPVRLPTMTLSLRKTPQGLVITDEALIPAEFWKEQPKPAPELDKNALIEALKSKKSVKGAELDNGGKTLTIRRA
jgi:hypothetical protein